MLGSVLLWVGPLVHLSQFQLKGSSKFQTLEGQLKSALLPTSVPRTGREAVCSLPTSFSEGLLSSPEGLKTLLLVFDEKWK